MTTDTAKLYKTMVEVAADAIVVTDASGVIEFWNHGAERIFGFPQDEAVGQSLDIIIPAGIRARHWEGFNRVMETGKSRYGEGELLAVPGMRKDGSRISIEFTIVPFHDEQGRMAGMGAILRDVTTRFEEVRDLKRRLAAAGGPAG